MQNLTNTSPSVLPQNINGSLVHPYKPEAQPRIISYCLYARKSSEDDERQALSIDSQIREMAVQAQTQGLRVIEIRKESHSAKESGQRPIFNGLIEDVRKGLFQGILSWAPDRLSRNAGDLGTIVDLMDNKCLTEIRTHGQVFTNSPNDKFLLMILCSQAKLENDNRGINVRRGLKTKCELGFRPNLSPLGYLNDHYSGKGQKQVFIDKERAPLIKEAFEKVAYQGYSGRDIYNWFKDVVNFRTRKGKLVTLSSVYEILNNTYYCGMFEFPIGSGKWYKGSYEPIITRELFDDVQAQLTVHPKTKPGTKEFDFTKMLKCGACGSGVTAEEKFKRYVNGTIRRYVYYHCTQSRHLDCKEPYIREEDLIEEFIKVLDNLSLDQIKAQEKLKEELERFQRFSSSVLGIDRQESFENIDIQKFVKYVLQECSREEKSNLLSCLQSILYLKDRHIVTSVQKLNHICQESSVA